VYAYLQREPGTYNNLVLSSGFFALWVVVVVLLVLSFVYGMIHFVWPIVLYVYLTRIVDRKEMLPEGWISPGEARYWRPDVSTIIRLSSLYCLLSWIISWRYKRTPFKMLMYYTAVYAAIVAICLMVFRWCGIVRQVQGSWVYSVMRVWALVQLVIATIAGVATCAAPYLQYNEGFWTFRVIIHNYIQQSTLFVFSLMFSILCTCMGCSMSVCSRAVSSQGAADVAPSQGVQFTAQGMHFHLWSSV
jgi:hypothetical protein